MITNARIDAIYDELNGYTLELGDPNAFGPRYFIDKIATCRNWLNAVSLIVSELSREKLRTGSELRRHEAIYELESAALLATDDAVRRLANIKDRESMVSHLLREQKQRIELLKAQMVSIDAAVKISAHRSRELHSTMDAIKNQRRFMQIEVSVGSFYGDERLPAHETSGMGAAGTTVDGFDEAELNAMFEGMGGVGETKPAALPVPAVAQQTPEEIIGEVLEPSPKVVVQTLPEVVATVTVAPGSDDEAIQNFLNDYGGQEVAGNPPSARGPQEDQDFSALLDLV